MRRWELEVISQSSALETRGVQFEGRNGRHKFLFCFSLLDAFFFFPFLQGRACWTFLHFRLILFCPLAPTSSPSRHAQVLGGA